MSKRLALCLFGLSVHNNYSHWDKENTYFVNYQNSVLNYRKYIYNYFQEKGYTIDVYLSSNQLNYTDRQKLLATYQPIKYLFKNRTDNINVSRNLRLDSVIDLCMSTNIMYDLVLITRFDLHFQKNFNDCNIDFNKMNIVSILERPDAICDNFYLLPFHMLPLFSTIVKNNIHISNHFIKEQIDKEQGPDFINYILNEYCKVQCLSFYKIIRSAL